MTTTYTHDHVGGQIRCHKGCPAWYNQSPTKPPRDEYDQSLPEINKEPIIQELVKQDIQTRLEIGIQRYGTGLQPNNGRDMLKDAYDEAMDLVMYLRGCLYERDGR